MSLPPGTRLGPYEIGTVLGAGGMGEVYKARDTRLDRNVAVKVSKEQYSERFAREARTIAALNHPGICTLHDVGPNYLVMEFIEGERLKGPLPFAQVVKYAVQIADALDAAHTQGVIHRDIKPSNVFVTPRGHTKVLDFGLAKLAELRVEPGTQAETEEMLTSPGSTPGTVSYMSPEQARGEPLDFRTDLWSLGVLLYEGIAGKRPFTGATSAMVFEAILNKPPAPLPDDVPAELQRIVLRLLEKDRAKRYASAAAVRDDLAKLESELSASRSAVVPQAPSRAWWKYAVAAAGLAVIAAGGVLLWQSNQTPPLTDRDVLVLADFTNTTGDPVFDVTLREALAIQLEESPFLKILDDGQVQETLQRMGRNQGERITNQIAREVCVRTGQKAMISGAIAAVGKTFALTLQAVNCQSQETLARVQAEAVGKEQVLAAMADAARELREKLGESLASIQRVDPVEYQITTSSLAAFQAFALGRQLAGLGDDRAAILHLQRAIELDHNFASAHSWLSVRYSNLGNAPEARENARQAFALVDRVSEQERLRITAVYHQQVTGDLNKAAELLQELTRLYPRLGGFHNTLGVIHDDLGQHEQAIREYQEAIRLGSGRAPYTNLIRTYSRLDRFNDARAVSQQAAAAGFDTAALHRALLDLAYREGNEAAAERELQWFVGKPEAPQGIAGQANQMQALGQFRKAFELAQRGGKLKQGRGGGALPGPPLATLLGADRGTCSPEQRTAVRQNLSSQAGQEIQERIGLGLQLALCGETRLAEQLVEEASKELPSHTLINGLILPVTRAAIELERGEPLNAIEILRPASRFELNSAALLRVRGAAYLRAGKSAEAAAEFQKIVDHRGAFWGPPYPQAMVDLARVHAQAGDPAGAKRAYEDFFALWKDADADAPLLMAAKKEYAALK